MALAHSITTHAVDADIDWFTAVDDLVAEEGEVGAGHLDTQEFSSGVFYRYASLNIGQLQKNLGDVSREDALKIGSHLLHMLSTIVPSAKRQSMPADNLADFTLCILSDIPVSLANAFESPVKSTNGSGFLQPSIETLTKYWSTVHAGYGLDEQAASFTLADINPPKDIVQKASLSDVKKWIETDGLG